MLFDKAIRKRQMPLPLQGHHEPDSRIISGKPEFSLQPDEFEPDFYNEALIWPQTIKILAEWQAIKIQPDGVFVGETVSGEQIATRLFYAPDVADSELLARASAYSGVKIIYKNQFLMNGQKQNGGPSNLDIKLELKDGGLVFEKYFIRQLPSELIQVREALPNGRWRITSPVAAEKGENILPLIGYGCYAPNSCMLSQVEQVYATIGSDGKEVSVKLYKESNLRQQGVVPSLGGTVQDWRYQFVDDANPSLMSDILNQRVRINVKIGDQIRTYVSISHQEVSQLDQLIYLTFKPEEGGK